MARRAGKLLRAGAPLHFNSTKTNQLDLTAAERDVGVRFLIGRAGSGKSAACAREIRQEMKGDPLGPPLLWIVPEQATFLMERVLISGGAGESRGSFRAQVLSFRRLVDLMARELGLIAGAGSGKQSRPMDELARLVLLEEFVRERRRELKIFSGVADRPGFLRKLDDTLRELRQHEQTGASLRKLTENSTGLDLVTTRKFTDLALLLDGWCEVLAAAETWDFEQVMREAAAGAERSQLIAGRGTGAARVWVDGFSAFSALEIDMLAALGIHARQITITLLADPASAGLEEMRGNAGGDDELADGGLFARTQRLHRRLVDAFRSQAVAIERTEFLRNGHRFESAALRRVEAELFEEAPAAAVAATVSQPARAVGQKKKAKPIAEAPTLFGIMEEAPDKAPEESEPGVEIWECSDPETEVRAIAQEIRELVTRRDEPLRYRQIGVIVPDLEAYQDALRRIFTEHRIPHFVDQRRSIAHHPLVELLRSIVTIATSRWDRNEVLLYLKTSLAGVAEGEVALVANYVMAHGIDHVAWSQEWRWFAPNQKEEDADVPEEGRELLGRVNAVREKVWGDLREWSELRTGAFAPALRGILQRLEVERQIGEWTAAARQGHDAELAQIHEQAWRQTNELLGVLEVLPGKQRTLEEFARLLATGLETLTLGLIPPTVDQVLVSSVMRSRTPELKRVFVPGAVEGQFPKVIEEDPILSDAQRDAINEGTGGEERGIGAGAERQLLEMPFFDYVTLTRASERVVVSYPLADGRGRAVAKSRYIERLKELFREEPWRSGLRVRRFDSGSRTAMERIGTFDDLLAGVAAWGREVIRRRAETMEEETKHERREAKDETGCALSMAAAYNWLVTAADLEVREALELVWPGVAGVAAPRLSEDLARRFYPPGRSLRLSVSQLEQFAECPLKYFMHYAMGLRPREILELDSLNLGTLYHRILERVYQKVVDGELRWPECEPAALKKVLDEEVDAACEELHEELAARTPGYDQMRARTKRTLGIVLEGERRRARSGDLRPLGVEVIFGGSRASAKQSAAPGTKSISLPVLQIATPGGARVELNGKIDRVDASQMGVGTMAAVIDYKSARYMSLDLSRVYHGLSLQLSVYALVMRELRGMQPIAALYLPLGLARRRARSIAKGAQEPGPDSDDFYRKNKPHGVVDAAAIAHLDRVSGDDAESKSGWYSIGFNKKEPKVPTRTDMLLHGDFATLMEFVRWKIGAMADDLMAGHIAPAPYREKKNTPCQYCDFVSLCPFDRASGVFRVMPKLERQEAVNKMRAAIAGKGEGA